MFSYVYSSAKNIFLAQCFLFHFTHIYLHSSTCCQKPGFQWRGFTLCVVVTSFYPKQSDHWSYLVCCLIYRKRKGKVRRNSNGVTDDMSLYNSIDFPNRSEASAGSDFDSILRSQQNQISCLQTNITPIHPIPLHMYVVSSKILLIVKDSTSRNHSPYECPFRWKTCKMSLYASLGL